nr:hypothetical protein BaRGS_021022 [Batillaria attramentaria]
MRIIRPTHAHNDCVRNHKAILASFPDNSSTQFAACIASQLGAEELVAQGRSSGSRVLVANLCVADLLMGVYLAMIGSADAHYSGQYLWKREEWTGSGLCQAAGVLGLMASEVSAMIICLITIDRLIVLRFPLKFHVHMTARSALLASGVAWMLGVLLAVTPFAADWEFYSQTGICLPLPITQRDFPGQHYSFGVFIVLNFVLFCLIGVGQVIIYRAIRDTHKAVKTHSTQQDMAVARRLFLIVFSDFCCWFPVGVMGLLAANGTPIPGVVNVWTAIFILPLNSAINPFLYTINSLLERRRKRAEDKRVKMMMRKLHVQVNSWPLDKMRASTVIFLLLVSSVLLTETEGWKWWKKVKKAVSNAWNWLKNHVKISVGYRFRRNAESQGRGDDPVAAELDEKCAEFNVGSDARFSEVVQDVFDAVDEDKDDELDEEEVKNFFKLIELLDYCVELEETKKGREGLSPH